MLYRNIDAECADNVRNAGNYFLMVRGNAVREGARQHSSLLITTFTFLNNATK